MLARAFSTRDFLRWYFVLEPIAIVIGYAQYAKALLEIIPFGFLLRTLFSPWKNLHDRKQERGFNLNRIVESLAFSILSRGVGCTVRLITIGIGSIFHIVLLVCSAFYLGLWIGFPVWAIVSIFHVLT